MKSQWQRFEEIIHNYYKNHPFRSINLFIENYFEEFEILKEMNQQ